MVTSKIEPCNRKSVDNFFQNRQEISLFYTNLPGRLLYVHSKPLNPFIHPRPIWVKKKNMRIPEFVLGFKALSTRIRFDLKTQLFLHGYGFRPHESDENHQWKRNFSKTLTWVELYENTVLVCTCGQSKTELFENAEDTLSVPKDGGRALHFLVFYPWAYF